MLSHERDDETNLLLPRETLEFRFIDVEPAQGIVEHSANLPVLAGIVAELRGIQVAGFLSVVFFAVAAID